MTIASTASTKNGPFHPDFFKYMDYASVMRANEEPMPCTAHPSPTTQATVRPQAATEPTIAAGCPPTQSTASPSASTSVGDAAGNTTPARRSHLEAQTEASLAIFHALLLSASLYSSLADNPNPTREQAAEWVGKAGQMHRHSEEAIGALVNVYTELITQ